MFATILCEAAWFSTCLLAVFKVMNSILLLVISLFCCLFFLDLLLTGCFFLEISPLLLGCPTLWHITAYKQSLMIFLCLCSYQLLLRRFHFFFGSSLILGESGQRFVNFILSKKQNKKTPSSWFYSILLLFLCFVLFIYSLIFIISFLLVILGFVIPFLIVLGGRLGCLLGIFLTF